jgi:hypothetical protein
MAPKYRPTPLSGGDRKALTKEIAKSRVMTGILAERSYEKRRVGEASTYSSPSPAARIGVRLRAT